jgi:glutaminyl-tRNA synthetase
VHLFAYARPHVGGKDSLQSLNPDNMKVVTACVEPSLVRAQPDQDFQLERFGNFKVDRLNHVAGTKQVFNLVTGLKDS